MMEEMKRLKAQWVYKIPEGWSISRIKYLVDPSQSYPIGDGDHGMISADDYLTEGLPYIRVLNLSWGKGLLLDNMVYINEEMNNKIKNSELRPRDILIAKTGATIGKTAIVPDWIPRSNTTSHVGKITLPKSACPEYFYHQMCSEIIQKQIENMSAMQSTRPELGIEGLKNLVVVVPPLEEQIAIAAFLDDECAKLEDIITTVQQQIEILQTYRNSFVSEVITKGLNPNAQMKDSGILWVGKIPAHWSFKRLKYMLETEDSMRVGPFGSALSAEEYVEDGKWVYTQRVVLDNDFTENDAFISDEKYSELRGFKVKPGDILLTTRGTIGRTAIVPNNAPEGVLHPCIIRFRMNKNVLIPELAQLIFNETDFVRKQFVYLSNATTIDVIYSYSLKEILLPVIPENEQIEILSFLRKRLLEIDQILLEKKKQLKAIQDHKASVIFEYVTGKKRVKEVV